MLELIIFCTMFGAIIALIQSTYKAPVVIIWLLGLLTLIVVGYQGQKDINGKLTTQIQELGARVKALENNKAEMDVSATCVAWYFNTNLEEAKRRVCKK